LHLNVSARLLLTWWRCILVILRLREAACVWKTPCLVTTRQLHHHHHIYIYHLSTGHSLPFNPVFLGL
jgi:hypothetical protein